VSVDIFFCRKFALHILGIASRAEETAVLVSPSITSMPIQEDKEKAVDGESNGHDGENNLIHDYSKASEKCIPPPKSENLSDSRPPEHVPDEMRCKSHSSHTSSNKKRVSTNTLSSTLANPAKRRRSVGLRPIGKNKLCPEKQQLLREIMAIEGRIRSLTMLVKYEEEGENDQIEALTEKWRCASQTIATDLFDKFMQNDPSLLRPSAFAWDDHDMPNGGKNIDSFVEQTQDEEMTMKVMFDRMGLDISLLGYDEENDCFIA
jgi:hypothetical protein